MPKNPVALVAATKTVLAVPSPFNTVELGVAPWVVAKGTTVAVPPKVP